MTDCEVDCVVPTPVSSSKVRPLPVESNRASSVSSVFPFPTVLALNAARLQIWILYTSAASPSATYPWILVSAWPNPVTWAAVEGRSPTSLDAVESSPVNPNGLQHQLPQT